ncbi:MAG TPA: c-type cytochrome [Longimicrobiales bacterium]
MVRIILVSLTCVLAGALPAAAQADGKAIFEGKGNCHACHGKDARGTVLAPNLTDGEWLNVDGSRASIINLIQKGVPKPIKHPAPMPPMGGASLSKDEVEALATYVLSLAKKADGS